MLILLLAACGDPDGLVVRNNEPEPTILAPLADDTLVEGYAVTLLGSVTDTNDPPERLVATWLAGDTELCPEAPLASDGSTSCEITVDPEETSITLFARDTASATGTATLELVTRPNEAPTVTVEAPDGPGPYEPGSYIVVEAFVRDGEDPPADLTLAWTDDDGAAIQLDTVVDTDGGLTGALVLATGTHTLTLTATDRLGAVGSGSVTVTVAE